MAQSPYPTVTNAPLPYDNTQAIAQHAFQQATAALNRQKAQSLQYYGYRQGRGGNYKFDANNRYGAFQMQASSQGQQLEDLTGAQQQSGLWSRYGGQGLAAGQRTQALTAQGFEQANLLKEFQQKMDAIRLGRREARWQRNQDSVSGTLQSILSSIAAGQFTPAGPVGFGVS